MLCECLIPPAYFVLETTAFVKMYLYTHQGIHSATHHIRGAISLEQIVSVMTDCTLSKDLL